MTDIEAFLRLPVQWGYLGDHGRFIEDNTPIKAADEIKQLRAVLEWIVAPVQGPPTLEDARFYAHRAVYDQHIMRLEAEIERLRAVLQKAIPMLESKSP